MHSLLSRRGPLLGSVVGATVLLTASTAFACTQTAGKIVITGKNGTTINGSLTGSATYQGDGGDELSPTLGYCGGPPSRVTLASSPAAPNKVDFNLAVSGGGCVSNGVNGPDDLPAGTYDVRWAKQSEDAVVHNRLCHGDRADLEVNDPRLRTWVSLGNIVVDPNPATVTNKVFSLPPDGNPLGLAAAALNFRGPGNICLSGQPVVDNKLSPIVFMKWNI